MKVRSRRFTGVAHRSDFLSSLHFFAFLHFDGMEVSVTALVAVAMVDEHMVAVAALVFLYLYNNAVAGGVDAQTHRTAEVDAAMEFSYLIERVGTLSVL